MIYGSVCSGIEAATQAWHPIGWAPAWFSEIDPFPSAVLAHHYPNVPNLGDMNKFQEWPNGSIDLLVGGTPCQSFSIAGLRAGLDDPRGNLMLTYLSILGRYHPRWCIWENVPGVLSSNGGRDFGTFLTGLAELGYGFAYRVLDAQYFKLATERRRVFVVGYLGDWRRAAAVLFDRGAFHITDKARPESEFISFCPSSISRGFGMRVNRRGTTGTLQSSGSETNPAICFKDGRCRYLTPAEWERALGFDANYTNIPWRNKNGSPDGRRYKALGNSMAVNVMRWIGRRIEWVETEFPC